MHRLLCRCLVLLSLTICAPAGIVSADKLAPPPLNIGDQLQLFLDDQLIESHQGVQLKMHSPRPTEVILRRDQPWEDSTLYDPVVILDGDRYRLWYRTNFNSPPFHTGYAESADGIHWTKPSLGIVEFQGSTDNNLVWTGNHAAPGGGPTVLCVFKDPNPDVPADERYKATGLAHGNGLQGLVSPDGLRWKLLQTERVVPAVGAFDTHSISFFDTVRSEYVVYTRAFVDGVRRIRRTASRDFRSFPVAEVIPLLNPDVPMEHLYKNAATPYYRRPDLIFMFPKRFVESRTPDPKWVAPGVSDIVFMFSRDGLTFDRRYRDAFIRPGPDPLNWHERGIEVGPGLVPTGPSEMSLYYIEHYRTDAVQIRRGALRIDGITSVHADFAGGQFVTRPFTFTGDTLTINYATSAAGSVQFELLSADGAPLPGFTMADGPELYGDRIDQTVRFSGDLGTLAGRPVRLRCVMHDADLYSLQFVESGR